MNFAKQILDGITLWISVFWKPPKITYLPHQKQIYKVIRLLLNQGSLVAVLNHYFEHFTVVIMTWLTVSENRCHKWLRNVSFVIVEIIHPYIPWSWPIIGFWYMSNTTDDISGAEMDYPAEVQVQYSTDSFSIMPSQSVI
jgi:hypothetical protein